MKSPKLSAAKQFASIEAWTILGTSFEMGAFGLWTYANNFARSAKALPPVVERFEPVGYYLICHALELALKAFLSLEGTKLIDLAGGAYGHDLSKLLAAADTQGLSRYCDLTDEHRLEIIKATTYYAGKVFEYPAMGEALGAYPHLPILSTLASATDVLIAGLKEPCMNIEA